MYKIAISGKARSGKNTLASIILEELAKFKGKESIASKTLAFADPIKEIISKMFPYAEEKFLYGSSELRSMFIPEANNKSGGLLSYRQALIDIGELGRSYNPSTWVNCFNDKYQKIIQNNKILSFTGEEVEAILVPDVRYKEELEYLKNNNFFLIKIKRKDCTYIQHSSETDQDMFNQESFQITINNDGTVKDLELIVKTMVLPKICDNL